MSVQLAGGATVRQQSGHRRQEGSVEERTRYIHKHFKPFHYGDKPRENYQQLYAVF